MVCLAMVALFESALIVPGAMGGDKIAEYYTVLTMELLTICLIPLSLRLFKFGFVARAFARDAAAAMTRWGMVRIAMLALPMLANTLLYYLFVHVAFGYMAIIGLLSIAFVFPTVERCRQEMKLKE